MSSATTNPAVIRFTLGPVLILAVLGILWVDHDQGVDLGFTGILGIGVIVALVETYRMLDQKGMRVFQAAGVASAIVYLVVLWISMHEERVGGLGSITSAIRLLNQVLTPESVALLLLGVLLTLDQLALKGEFNYQRFSGTLFGFLIPVFCLGFMMRLRGVGQGELWIVYLFITNKANDSAAYMVGKTVGGPKMAPTVSPNKTWSGSVAGLTVGTAGAIAVWVFQGAAESWSTMAWIGMVLGTLAVVAAAQVSDLLESSLKRWAGTKDSGNIPAFGGVLDMFDSFILSAPAAYLLAVVAGRLGWIQ
jgi:phosphatidate cytidylyltransferase